MLARLSHVLAWKGRAPCAPEDSRRADTGRCAEGFWRVLSGTVGYEQHGVPSLSVWEEPLCQQLNSLMTAEFTL